MDVVSGASIGIVAALAVAELWATLAPPPGGAARPRASAEDRCPYCHEALADGTPRVRCASCGTKHHRACWAEHRRCSVFGCESTERRAVRSGGAADAAPASEPMPAPEPTLAPEPTPVPVAAAAPADPAG